MDALAPQPDRQPAPHKPRVDWASLDPRLIALAADGQSGTAIARALKVTRDAVIGRVKRLAGNGVAVALKGNPAKPGVALPHVKDKAVALARHGHSIAEIVVATGASRGVVERALKAANLTKRDGRKSLRSDMLQERMARRREHLAAADVAPLEQRFAEGYRGQTGRVALTELRAHHCRFPVDQADGPLRYCGADVEREGARYCPQHAARVFAMKEVR